MEALRVWPTIDQDVIHECTQRKEREWWEGDKHIAVMAMTEVLCPFYVNLEPHYLGWFDCHAISQYAQCMIGYTYLMTSEPP